VPGVEVRNAHQRMGRPDVSWPRLPAPRRTGAVTVFDVAAAGAMVDSVAGHTSVSFTLDRYGHLYPEADANLRDRLDALHTAARPPKGLVVDLSRQDRSPQPDGVARCA